MRKLFRRLLVGFARVIVFFVVLVFISVGIYAGWSWWGLRELRSFCADVHPGLPVSALPDLAEKHGFDRHWVQRGVIGNDGAFWTFVPASPLGRVACAIRHNEAVVLSAREDG